MKDLMTPNAGGLEFKDASGVNETKQGPDTNEIKKLLDGYDQTVQAFMTKTDETLADLQKKGQIDPLDNETGKKMQADLDGLKKSIDNLRLAEARPVITGPDGQKTALTDDQIEHKQKFDAFFRKGNEDGLREMEAKTLSVGSDPDGGYTVPVQMETAIDRVITEISPIRSVARVVQVSTASYKKRVSMGGATSGWVGEQADRDNTNTPKMDVLEFPVMELYANPSATQSILDDSAISIDEWLSEEVSIEFAQQEGAAFINGNGAAKPRGFMSYDTVEEDNWSWGKLGHRNTGVNGGFLDTDPGDSATNIIDLTYALKPAFRSNARFAMNRKTVSDVMKLRDADGRPLWHTNLREGQPDLLMGYPILEAEDMPDISAGSKSIVFGDFRRGYIIVDRMGVRVLRDPFSAKPYIQFYTTKRVGGGIGHYEALKFLRFSA